MTITKDEIQAMSATEKHQLLDMLWESLEKENYIDNEEAETELEQQVLQERLQDYNVNPSTATEWEKLKADLLNKKHD